MFNHSVVDTTSCYRAPSLGPNEDVVMMEPTTEMLTPIPSWQVSAIHLQTSYGPHAMFNHSVVDTTSCYRAPSLGPNEDVVMMEPTTETLAPILSW
ncbi:hypothetical protein GRJ2_002709900 [Grus japonensis]|uniref:Uncharacterized protein n=1 Tax=Grus japonensis TaxID=30415 RepID=A0ABC9XXE9_GRUJA